MSEEQEEVVFAAYALDHTPVVYIGELETESDVVGDPRLVFRKVLVQMHIPQDPKGGTKRQEVIWSPPMAANRDSVVIIDRASQPGVLVLGPDPKIVDEYKKELARIYSGIHLL